MSRISPFTRVRFAADKCVRFGSIVACIVVLDVAYAPSIQASSSLADGNGDGMSTRLFRTAVDSKGFFTVNGTDVVGKNDIFFGLVLDGGFGLLRLHDKVTSTGTTAVDRATTKVIDSQFHGVLFLGWSPIKSLVLSLGVPTDLVSGDAQHAGQSPFGLNQSKTDVNAFGTGTWSFNVKLRLLRVEDQAVGLALVGAVDVPLSSDAKMGYASDPTPSFHPTIAIEKRFGAEQRFRVGVNVGASLMGSSGSSIGDLAAADPGKVLQHGNLGRFGVALAYRVSDPIDLVAETYGSYLLKNDAGISAGTSAEGVGGIKVFVERNSYLMLGGGVGYVKGYQAADERGFLGFVFEPSIGDRDGDGIKDDVDKCPDEPEDRDGFQDEDGCPDPDNDIDHILDRDDACPNDPETMNGIADADGCPDGLDDDRDHDHVKNDKCPDEPEDPDGFQDADGCPDPDNDIDKIDDKDDACPDVPENFNNYQDADGCPDVPQIVVLEPIQFDYDSAKIKKESMPVIDSVAKILVEHDEYLLVEIGGHADERGDDVYNLKLTQARVDSVRRALMDRKIDGKRLRAQGYGEYCPLDPAHDDAAWSKNRRVEFKILRTKDGPTGAVLGCDNAAAHGVKPAAP
jgi:outer membrane protein OmpA-like peptidoglycan-associated protein